MQSNANRLRIVLKNTKALLPISGALIIVLNIRNTNWLSSAVSGIWIIITIAWWFFNKYLWKNKWINKKLKLTKEFYCPIIGGRWEGNLNRDGVDHKFVVEIKQTYTSISCVTYSLHSHSECICAELLYDEQNEFYSFVYLWQGKTLKSPDGRDEPSNYFNGTTILRISDDCSTLTGSYFTDRTPNQTKGRITLSNRQEVLKNAF